MAVDRARLQAYMRGYLDCDGYTVDPFAAGIEALDAYDYEQAAQGHDVIGWFPTPSITDIVEAAIPHGE